MFAPLLYTTKNAVRSATYGEAVSLIKRLKSVWPRANSAGDTYIFVFGITAPGNVHDHNTYCILRQ